MKDFIFISGLMRTGTSVLMTVLKKHPAIHGVYEAGFATALRLLSDCPTIVSSQVFVYETEHWSERGRCHNGGSSKILGDLPKEERLQFARDLAYLMKKYAQDKIICDKQPNDIANLTWVKEVFGDKCLTILTKRRWESMIASWINLGSKDDMDEGLIMATAKYYKEMEKKVVPDITIQYEEFVLNPLESVSRIFEKVGLPIDVFDLSCLKEVHTDSLNRWREYKEIEPDNKNLIRNLFE